MEALQVFAIDADKNRLTGSIPYKSLTWHRRYYEPGEFEMVVPANVFSTEWAYIVAYGRPELGMVQKVTYSDDQESYAGIDSVTVAGFFLEAMLNELVFLVEETEQEAYYIPKPTRAARKTPTIVQTSDGKLYSKDVSFDGSTHYRDVTTGTYDSSVTDSDVTGVEIKPIQGSMSPSDYTSFYYSNYIEGDKLVSTSPGGFTHEYELVSKPSVGSLQAQNGFTLVKDDDGNLRWCTGAGIGQDSTYYRQVDAWEKQTEGMEIVQLPGGGTAAKGYREIKGPWQLHTGVGDVGKKMDNVQQVIEWAQLCFAGQFLYDEPGFTGETKVVDASLTRIGDLFFEEMKSIEAGVRLLYDFLDNQIVFSIWRGLDRTQSQKETPAPRLPDGYTEIEYVEGSGSAYFDSGFVPDQSTRVLMKVECLDQADNMPFWGARESTGSDSFTLFKVPGGMRCDYGSPANRLTIAYYPYGKGAIVIDMGPDGIEVAGTHYDLATQTFATQRNLALLAVNTAGSIEKMTKARVYYCEIYDGDTIVRNYIPAKRDSDGKAGLYDFVSKTFNAGVGTMTAGQEIEYEDRAQNSWAVFSDTWGTLHGYTATRDGSNYRNTCYVLYDYWTPAWGSDGKPAVESRTYLDDSSKKVTEYRVSSSESRGFWTVRLSEDQEDTETWLDKRSEGPEGMDSIKNLGEWSETQPDIPDTVTKEKWEAWVEGCKQEALKTLRNDYGVVESLDSGTYDESGYLTDWDLGDKVDMQVSTIGMVKEARITEVTEVHESGKHSVQLTLGEETFSAMKRASLN